MTKITRCFLYSLWVFIFFIGNIPAADLVIRDGSQWDKDRLSIVFMGHVRPGYYDTANPLLAELMEKVKQDKQDKPDMMVFGGDCVYGYRQNDEKRAKEEWDVFFNIVNPMKIPYALVPGNHDVGMVPFGCRYKKNFPKYLPRIKKIGFKEALKQYTVFDPATLRYYKEIVGKIHYSFENKNSMFIVLDSVSEEWPLVIGKGQRAFLEDRLKKARVNKQRVIVFIHHPLWIAPRPPLEYSFQGYLYTEAAEDWMARVHPLLPPGTMVFAGNAGGYTHEKIGHVNYYRVGIGKFPTKNSRAYAVIRISPEDVEVKPVYPYPN